MQHIKIYFLLVASLFTAGIAGYAQNLNFSNPDLQTSALKFEYFNVESGLSNNTITDIAQDSLGYIWISTMDGLNRYNGSKFYDFKQENGTINSLNYNLIEHIKLNTKGELLVATNRGLNIYNPKKEAFTLFDESNGLVRANISCLELGKGNDLILGINGEGIQFFNPNSPAQSVLLKYDPNVENSLSSNAVHAILLQGKNTLWAGTWDNGLDKINYYTKEVKHISLGDKSDTGLLQITSLFLDKNNNLWVGTRSGIVIITNNNEKIYIRQSAHENYGLSDKEVLSFEEDYMGNIWVGTQNGGLNIINLKAYRSNKKYIKWYLPNQNGNNFQGRGINKIFKDKDDNMWVGTFFGLYFINPKDTSIEHIKQKLTKDPVTISSNYIRSISEHYTGEIWIGTDGAGVNLYNPKTGTYKYYNHDEKKPLSLSNNYIYDVFEDSKHRVWVGTYRGGLNLLNPLTGNTKKYLQGSIENGYKVNVIYEDNLNTIWVGTNRGGLYKYNETLDLFEYVLNNLGKIDVRDITEDAFGNLWMATYGNGVIKYNPKTGDYKEFTTSNTSGLSSNIMYAIVPLPDKTFLVGSGYGGLFKLYPEAHKTTNYTAKNGLSNNTVNSMVFRNKNEVWLGTYNGLSYFDKTTETIKNLNSFDNIPQSDFNIGAAFKAKDGRMYFGSNNGLYIISPDKLFAANHETHLIFETIKVFNDKLKINQDQSKGLLKQSLPYLNHITLNHDQTLITIDFCLLKYPNSENTKYAYLLEGYQDQWININNSNSINLSKLPPGEYNLLVKGIINPEQTVSNSLLITINPPFWKTLPAYILYLIILSVMVWIGMKYYSERLKLKNSLLFEKKERQLENELNLERVRFFTSFSHELKTPLSLIIAPVENLIEKIDKKKHKEQLQMVLKNSKYLLKNIQKLLEFRKSELGLNKLSIEKVNISDYISQILNSYKPVAKSRGINLKIEKSDKDIFILCDIEKIEIILHNLLSNAFKYSEKNDHISVSVKTHSNRLLISVTDTGKGISEQDLPHIFDWYYQSNTINRKKGSGIGLALSKIFAELHMGSIHVESKYNEGSSFTLNIPMDVFLERTSDTKYMPITESEAQTELKNTAEIWEYQERSSENISLKSKIKHDKTRELLLIVDDNSDILQFLSGLLEQDYDLIFAENGAEGIQKAIKYVPDLVISDVMMPIESGIVLCKALKKNQTTSHIPIILLTAKANTEGVNEGYEEGADDYITKPFNSKILKTRIRNLIQNRLKLKDYFNNEKDETSDFEQNNKGLLDSEKAFLHRFEAVIDKLITEGDTNTDAVCAEMGMSRTSLFRKLKVLTGSNINEFVRNIRLKKAVHLIKHQNYTISEASFEVGFNSVKYFRKLIKEEYGILPSKLSDNSID